ncbi:MAG: PDZ domain-containing protein [Gemmataceae bacterium]
MRTRAGWAASLAAVVVLPALLHAAFHAERRVREATRLEWEFAVGPGAKLPAHYDSRRQRYQLFVPPAYDDRRAWPLILFVSPGDDALGWRAFQRPCEGLGYFFVAPYGSGAGGSAAQRYRALLDVLDDVRREFRIDPEQTYLAGLGAGAETAAHLATSYPEYCAGIVALGGDVPLPRMPHLRHRLMDRLSVALLAPPQGNVGTQQKLYLAPVLRDLGVRARYWPTPDDGLPPSDTLREVLEWLADDLKRRRQDAATAGLMAEETPNRRRLAARAVARARADLTKLDQLYRTVSLLDWVVARCGEAPDARAASELLLDLRGDEVRGRLILKQGEAELRHSLAVRARGLEARGDLEAARRAWDGLVRLAEGDEKVKAHAAERRLAGLLAQAPYLGLTFAGSTLVVKEVVPGGPAARAGLRAGDGVESINGLRVSGPGPLREQMQRLRPGDPVTLGVRREGKPASVEVRLAAVPPS